MDKTHMQTHSRYRTARRILLFWTLFIGVGAVAGAAGMLLDPSGRALLIVYLRHMRKVSHA